MRRSIGWILLCLSLAGALPEGARADFDAIVVEVASLRSDRGSVRVALYPANAWIEQGRELATCHTDVHYGRATCVLTDVRPGTYALAVLHDEDDDGSLDRDFLGLPQEGFGFSNDAAPGFGPPSFRDASFHFEGGETDLVVHARYGL